MDTRVLPIDPRYLRTPDGTVYGPVESITLCAWAADARVTPGCEVSRDGKTWAPAVDQAELRMQWQAALSDGATVGPLNLFALWELIQDGSLPPGTLVSNRVTGELVPLDERLLPVALKESREMLGTMAARLSEVLVEAGATAPDPAADALKARLAQAERELANHLRLMGESQRLLVARDAAVQALEKQAAAAETRLHETLRDLDGERQARRNAAGEYESRVAQLAGERDELAARRTALEAELNERRAAVGPGEAREAALASQLAAVQQAAQVIKTDYEARLAAAERTAAERAAAETARGEAERRELTGRLAAAEAARETLASELAGVTALLAEARAARELGGRRAQELEEQLREARAAGSAAEQRFAEVESAARETLEQAQAARRAAETEVSDWQARCRARDDEIAALRQSQADAEAGWRRDREAGAERLKEVEVRASSAERKAGEIEKQLSGEVAAHERTRSSAGQAETTLRNRITRLERDLEQATRRATAMRGDRDSARQALQAERTRAAEALKQLQGELKLAQRDVHALNLAKTVSRHLTEDRSAGERAMIDWMASGGQGPAPAAESAGAEGKGAADLPAQLSALCDELKAAMADKERLRAEAAKRRAENEELQKRLSVVESSLQASTEALQRAGEPAPDASGATAQEMERRETEWRRFRQKAEDREKELKARVAELEAELTRLAEDAPPVEVEGEWHPPARDPQPPPGPNGAPPPPPPRSASGANGAAVLNTVEAQLRAELEKWHTLNQQKDRASDKSRRWFRWKQAHE